MVQFLQTHQCNAICRHLRLDIVNPKPIVYGTRPAKMYMDSQKVKVIENVGQLSNDAYHKIPTIPMSTLNDYYLQQIYKMRRGDELDQKEGDDTGSSMKAQDRTETAQNLNGKQSRSVSVSDAVYNPLTPLLQKETTINHMEDTECGLCHCHIL